MAEKDKKEVEELAPDPAAQPRVVTAAAPAAAPPGGAPVVVHPPMVAPYTPEEIGPGPAFDPVVRYKVLPATGPPEKAGKKVRVLYRGPSDSFQIGEYALDRLEPAEMPEGVLQWLRANHAAHSFEELPD